MSKHLMIQGVHVESLCSHPDCERRKQIRNHMQDENTRGEGELHWLFAEESLEWSDEGVPYDDELPPYDDEDAPPPYDDEPF